ncbi:MAG TPA: metallophosphoesterase family protein [Chloroflexia bacterium]|nr:metallophosphoesterase family protein [Chloroflexia bacterium]
MRIGIVSDIHANLAAFEIVLGALQQAGAIDRLWCIGDMVGYGPHPNECLDLLRSHDHICVPGNHDFGLLGKTPIQNFNADARFALDWTASVLTESHRTYLDQLPLRWLPDETLFTVVHASPRDPIWEYLLDTQAARESFPYFTTPYCLVGHTHVPVVFRQMQDGGPVKLVQPEPGEVVRLAEARLIINPGSVGQPRDGNPQAAYAIFDQEAGTLQFARIDYPIAVTQLAMRQLNFPKRLIARLEYGY